ncbi:MAG: HupE/UreJ family protein [Gallionella sp.]
MSRKFVIACIALTPMSALAHPGEHHQGLMATLVHLLTEPDHLAMAAITLLIGIWGVRRLRVRRTATNR